MVDNWKNKTKSYEEYDKIMRESAKGAPSTEQEVEEALKEFEREWDAMSEEEREEFRQADKRAQALAKGDYSSLDPELRKEIEERERKEKNKKVAEPKRKEARI